ncbi:TolC family protein [uncultured Fusobacterium sp.]|jgi:outer membrane protein TolC|uniref:TolC family protein n=1 Tax=uncultured Fusobacterium sp. TaxID=159267 RepID=UPI00258A5C5F|nr:TolC family protein [uncultured Fusobacterium sp.]
MKKVLFLVTALLLVSCSSKDVKKEREDILINKERVTSEILKQNSVLTLDDAINISVNRNLDIKTKEIEYEIAKLDKRIAFGNFLPKISLSYSRTMLDDNLKAKALDTGLEKLRPMVPFLPATLEARVLDKDFSILTVNAQLPIFVPSTWFLYDARVKGENISLLTKDLTVKMIKLQTIGKYYYILALQSEREYLQKELEATEQLKHNASLAFKTGSILEWEYKRVEVLNDTKKHALTQNERDLKVAKISLLNTLDLYPFADITLEKPNVQEDDDNLTLDTAIYEALKNSDLISIREQAEGVGKDITKIAISQFLPKIVLTGGYVNTDAKVLVNDNFFMGTLGGLFSIFNGFQNINEYKKAKQQQKIFYIKKEQEITKVILETVNAYNQYSSAKEEMNIANNNFNAMEGMLHQKKLEKDTGYIDDWEYIQALADFENALSLKEKATFKYRVSKATLDMLMEKSIFVKGDNKDEIK